MNNLCLCLDIGGTHITAAVVERQENTLNTLSHVRESVDSMADKDVILTQWNRGIDGALANISEPIAEIYVSIPGPFDYQNGVSLMDGMHKYQSILHMNVKSYLSERYDIDPAHIYFYNDAQAFLLGEVFYFNLSDKKVIGLTLGTGLGSAFYENGKVTDLNYGSARFREGIAEDYISTRGILQAVKTAEHQKFQNVKDLVWQEEWQSEKVQAFEFLRHALLEFIEDYIKPLNPDCIIIGGSIAHAHTLFLEQVQSSVAIPLQLASMDEINVCYGMIANVKFNTSNN